MKDYAMILSTMATLGNRCFDRSKEKANTCIGLRVNIHHITYAVNEVPNRNEIDQDEQC